MRKKVLVVGSFVMDLIVETEEFPNRGETVLGTSFCTAPGGKGANQAVQMALLDLDVSMAGKVADDDFGKALINSVEASGVNTKHVKENGTFTSVGNVQIENNQKGIVENRIIVVPGANMEINCADMEFLKTEISDYSLLVLQHEIPLKINKYVRQLAKKNNVPVLLNPAPSYDLDIDDYFQIDYLVPNEHELMDLCASSSKIQSLDDVINMAKSIINRGTPNVIVTLGDRGSCWVTEDKYYYAEAEENVVSVDPTAAGDSFIGGLSYCILNNIPIYDSLRISNIIGAMTVSKSGAQTSLCNKQQVSDYIRSANKLELLEYFAS